MEVWGVWCSSSSQCCSVWLRSGVSAGISSSYTTPLKTMFSWILHYVQGHWALSCWNVFVLICGCPHRNRIKTNKNTNTRSREIGKKVTQNQKQDTKTRYQESRTKGQSNKTVASYLQWREIIKLQHTKTCYTSVCTQLSGNSLVKNQILVWLSGVHIVYGDSSHWLHIFIQRQGTEVNAHGCAACKWSNTALSIKKLFLHCCKEVWPLIISRWLLSSNIKPYLYQVRHITNTDGVIPLAWVTQGQFRSSRKALTGNMET